MHYHYTNIDSLVGIVSSKKLWFSSLAFMNDEMEGLELHQILSEVLGIKYDEQDYQSKLNLIEEIINTNLRFQLSFSATTLRDDISQWRAYTKIGQGVSIGFNDEFICNADAVKLTCLYDFEEKRSVIIRDRNLKLNDFKTDQILSSDTGLKDFVQSVVSSLVLFKNLSFKPEREVRWVISLNGLSDPRAKIKFRHHRMGLTLYQEVEVDLTQIESVTIGPQVPKQNLKTVEDLLSSSNCSGYVTQSKVTIRF